MQMKLVTNVFCSKKTGDECTCGCSCGTCRDWLGRYNSGLAGYYLKELMEDPSKLEEYQATQVGKWFTDKSLAARVYRKEQGETFQPEEFPDRTGKEDTGASCCLLRK